MIFRWNLLREPNLKSRWKAASPRCRMRLRIWDIWIRPAKLKKRWSWAYKRSSAESPRPIWQFMMWSFWSISTKKDGSQWPGIISRQRDWLWPCHILPAQERIPIILWRLICLRRIWMASVREMWNIRRWRKRRKALHLKCTGCHRSP